MKTRFLGKKTPGISKYSPKILEKVERANIQSMSSFFGCDFWNAYEFSFLNSSNQPVLETLEIIIPMTSLNTSVIIIAAGLGSRLKKYTNNLID